MQVTHAARDERIGTYFRAAVRLAATLVAAPVALSGCVPMLETYYEPVGRPTDSGDSPCGKNKLASFEGRGHGRLVAQVWRVHSPRTIRVLIQVNEGHTAQLVSTEIAFWQSAPELAQRGTIVDLARSGCRTSPRLASCQERFKTDSQLVATPAGGTFEAELAIPDAVGDDFFLQLPDVLFDGERLSIPPIEFRRRARATISTICT